ncbi:hypothetical protein [Aeromonas salmonicida]|uniref:InvB/SpaK family type III secretion system chaperone n=1 Tax=Aeromonas salmonicida TaxID=645 RepID=UPI00232A9071|nr:hypothetical protein [Aeromonas salmonicida]WCH23628.1 hypothetical protein ONZ54_04465 [Aeromonas salmonicida]
MIHNPLSFSQNIHQDLSSLVRDALSGIGVSHNLLNDFDSHSTISIDLDEGLAINISLIDDRLFFWSLISLSEEKLFYNSRAILSILTSPVEFFETGHITLGQCDGGFELKALISLDALKENKLAQTITCFHSCLVSLFK